MLPLAHADPADTARPSRREASVSSVPSMGGPAKSFPPEFGYDLWVAYAVWIAIVVALYPVCRWFAAVKERNRSWWLPYF